MTIGLYQFMADPRISVDFSQRTSEWSLIIQDVTPSDEGVYVCQISTKDEQMDSSYQVLLSVKSEKILKFHSSLRNVIIQLSLKPVLSLRNCPGG